MVAIGDYLVIHGQEIVVTFFEQFKDVIKSRQVELEKFIENDLSFDGIRTFWNFWNRHVCVEVTNSLLRYVFRQYPIP